MLWNHQRANKGISKSRSVEGQRVENAIMALKYMYHHKCFHLIFLPSRYLVDVDYRCISTCFHSTVLFNGLEYFPPEITITFVTRKPEGDEKGFDSFWSVEQPGCRTSVIL